MILGDVVIASILQEELDNLRGDQRSFADLFANTPVDIQDRARRFFTDPDNNPISIRQGFTADPPKQAMISIVLAGEQEEYTPIGGHVSAGYSTDIDLSALLIQYTGNNDGVEVVVDPVTQVISSNILVPGRNQPVLTEEFRYNLTDYATVQLLETQINTHPVYSAKVSTIYASRAPTDLQGGKYPFDALIPVLASEWDDRSTTYFRSSWMISVMSNNVNETLWLHAFVKWALLRRRIDLEIQGIGGAQLSGGDFEPAAEWLQNWPNIFVRGVMLSGLYAAEYVDRQNLTEIKYVDVELAVPPSYLE